MNKLERIYNEVKEKGDIVKNKSNLFKLVYSDQS